MAEKTKKLEAELVQVRAQLGRTSSAKIDDVISIQKSVSDRTGVGYGLSSYNTASSNTTVFVPLANNVKIENNEIKTELTSENLDKGKSILGAPLSLRRKMLKTLGLRRLTLKSLNKRSNIFVIMVELPVILDQIATSGLPLNKATA